VVGGGLPAFFCAWWPVAWSVGLPASCGLFCGSGGLFAGLVPGRRWPAWWPRWPSGLLEPGGALPASVASVAFRPGSVGLPAFRLLAVGWWPGRSVFGPPGRDPGAWSVGGRPGRVRFAPSSRPGSWRSVAGLVAWWPGGLVAWWRPGGWVGAWWPITGFSTLRAVRFWQLIISGFLLYALCSIGNATQQIMGK
jgi:hypothetical protein